MSLNQFPLDHSEGSSPDWEALSNRKRREEMTPPAASPVERELELLKRIAGAANTIVAWFHPEDVRSGCVLINVEHYDELNAASDDYCKLLRDKTSPPPPSEKPSVTSVRSTEGAENE
jgi:hypothetical protein